MVLNRAGRKSAFPQLPAAPDDYPVFPDKSTWPVVFPQLPSPPGGGPCRPPQHTSKAVAPQIPAEALPNHVAVVMDGNGRWATQRGLGRTEGHKMGEAVLIDITCGAIELGVKWLTVYAFSTENWKRSAEDMTVGNDVITINYCVNYGGRTEIAEAAQAIAAEAVAGKLNPNRINEATIARHLHRPDMPDVDLLIRTSGEQRSSNFMLWQAAYAEYIFQEKLWPDYDRRDLWEACEQYASRQRRFGTA